MRKFLKKPIGGTVSFRKAETAILLGICLILVTLISQGYLIMNMCVNDFNSGLSNSKKVIEMEIVSADVKYGSTTPILTGDGGMMLFSGSNEYSVKFKHNNSIYEVDNLEIYRYCVNKIGQRVYLDVDEYENQDGVYERKINGIVNVIQENTNR